MDLNIKKAIDVISAIICPRYTQYKGDRQTLEQQWLKNIRQYRRKYDPEIEKLIPADKSHVYPGETHTKVVGLVAKLMEMMFPASDKNWSVLPTAIPSIPENELTRIITSLEQSGEPVSSEVIEAEVIAFAQDRARNMEKTIQDQLQNLGGEALDYPQICKKVIRSGAIYGFGVVKGPQVRYIEERHWERQADGRYIAQKRRIPNPLYSNCKTWDIFPDLAARSWREQEGIYERMVMNRHAFSQLRKRSDFIKSAVDEYLKSHPTGNYVASTYDTEINSLNHTDNVAKRLSGMYEVVRWLGYIGGSELRDAGVEVSEVDLNNDLLADIWFIDNTIVKCDKAAFGENPADSYHVFIYDEDEDSGLTGTGLPEVLRDSQLRLCSIDRATQDNMASCAGPIYEVNDDLIKGTIGTIHAFKTIHREGTGSEAGYPAVRQLSNQSHITDLITLRREVLDTFDRESSLPGWLFGQPEQLGEAFRTTNNMSQMTGGANMVTKDIVRAFDLFVQSLIGSVVTWNMEFNTDESIKGDFNVIPRGNLSLVAKEIRGAALDQFWSTLTPEERVRFKDYEVLIERLKARDLPIDLLEAKVKGDQKVLQYQQAQANAAQIEQDLTSAKSTKLKAEAEATTQKLRAEIAEILSRVDTNIANVKGVDAKQEMEKLKLLLQSLQNDLDHRLSATETAAKVLSMEKNNEPRPRNNTDNATPQ